MRGGAGSRASTLATDGAMAAFAALPCRLIGAGPFPLVQLPVTPMAATAGVWPFYVPPVPRWFSGDVGIHRVRHPSARIPSCRLPRVPTDHSGSAGTGRITIRESLATVGLTPWDEGARRLVGFREARLAA
jgi:omega-6 fatty acid desaturase (delta-12 desaturase)